MLHMVVHAHTAESCPFRSEENRSAMGIALGQLMTLAKAHGAEMQGSWVNTGAHVVFALVEAPSAHVVNTLMEASGLAARGTTTVYSVTELATQMAVMGMGSH